MKNKICLLGFSGSILSLIFNTLKDLKYSKDLIILENILNEDNVPFECDISYQRVWYENFENKSHYSFAFSMMKPEVKMKVFEFFRNKYQINRVDYANIIHPSVLLAHKCLIDKGIYIEPGCIISPYAKIGFGVSINRGCTIGHHTIINDFATINPGVNIAGHCNIGKGASIGIGTTIFDHKNIGNYSVIGGGSVVNKDIPESVMAFGNPCKTYKNLD